MSACNLPFLRGSLACVIFFQSLDKPFARYFPVRRARVPLWLFQSHGILSRHNLRLRAAEKIIINAFRLSFIIFYSDKVLQVIPGTKEALKYLNNLFDKNDFEVRYNLFV